MKRALVSGVVLALALTGCSDSDEDTTGQPTPTPTPTAATSACGSGPATTDLTKKPVPVLPAGSTSPAQTAFTDVVVGTGAQAGSGSDVEVKYVGVLFETCAEFDSSWSRGAEETLPFRVGGGVIPGFSSGTTGMKVGGRRQVVIPAEDGYGAQGSGPIPGGATLIFVIDLVTVG
jgi:hypothetical protein